MSEKRNWSMPTRQIADRPWATVSRAATDVTVYYDGDESFHVTFEPAGGCQFGIWTSAEGLRTLVGAAQAALVRAEA